MVETKLAIIVLIIWGIIGVECWKFFVPMISP